MTNRSEFLLPCSRYRGQVKPENLAFNANLQEFSQRVSLICGLETNGKLTPEQAFQQIEALWITFQRSKYELGVGCNPFQAEE